MSWPTVRTPVVLALVGLVGLAIASPAQGVILYSSAERNTTPPSEDDGLSGWNLQGLFGNFLATPITQKHFIASKHVGFNSTLTLGGQTYTVDAAFYGKGYVDDLLSDLRIYRIKETFPNWAALYNASVDGTELGKTLVVFGRGTQRGEEVKVSGASVSDLRGWKWGSSDGKMSWGKNVVEGFYKYNDNSPNSLLVFAFDREGISNECALSVGDSSGAVFIKVGQQWKLAGINYAATNYWSHTGGSDTGFAASIFDAGGLYLGKQNNWTYIPDHADDIPGASYASRISARLAWINSVVPVPGTLLLLGIGGGTIAVGWWLRRRHRTAPR